MLIIDRGFALTDHSGALDLDLTTLHMIKSASVGLFFLSKTS